MATVKNTYATSSDLTVTALNGGIGSSPTWVAGWTSGTIDNTSNLYRDIMVSGKFTVESSGLSAGEMRFGIYTMLDDSNWPDIFSAGTEGTEGTATIHDTEIRDSAFYWIWGQVTDTSVSRVYTMPKISVRRMLGFCPSKFACFFAQSTGTTLETSGNQVTIQGLYETIA
jgi:hypothetical protein